MFQLILILVLFVVALTYLGMIIYKSFRGEKSCEGNCKCATDKSSFAEAAKENSKIYKEEFT